LDWYAIAEIIGLALCSYLLVISALTDASIFGRHIGKVRSYLQNQESDVADFWRSHIDRLDVSTGLIKFIGLAGGLFCLWRLLGRTALLDVAAARVAVFIVTGLLFVYVADLYPRRLSTGDPETYIGRGLRLLKPAHLLLLPVSITLNKLLPNAPAEFSLGDETTNGDSVGANSGDSEHQKLLESVFEFPDTLVREVMIPRTEMVVLSEDMELAEILDILVECGHSRIPVCRGNMDDVSGLFYAKDLLAVLRSDELHDFEIQNFLREPYLVPETKPIGELLTEFQDERKHMAIVVDEFGGTAGLITLEDIIEEIFGDIQDEYDAEVPDIEQFDDDTFRVSASVSIDKLEEHLDIELPEHPEYESLGGFMLSQMGSVPKQGDELDWNELTFEVAKADTKRIVSVVIRDQSE
jgi:CBS domain containing-hemolysin-like protein